MTGTKLSSGELIIESGKIISLDEKASLNFSGETIDLSDYLLMPGFVNAHCHLTLSALKEKLKQNESFVDWIFNLLEEDSKISEEKRLEAFLSAADEMLQSGVTTFADYLGRPNWLPEYAKLPFRQVVFLEVFGFQSSKTEEIRNSIESFLKNGSPAPDRIALGIAPHAPYSVSPELFQALRKLADKYRVPFSCHLAESEEEFNFLQSGEGDLKFLLNERGVYDPSWNPPRKTTLQYLEDLNILDSLIAIHLNHLKNKILLIYIK